MIAITGGTGFIGSVLAWKFNELGIKDILIVDQNISCPVKNKNISKRSYLDCIESDVFIENLEKMAIPDLKAVFHMGACSSTTETNTDYLKENNFEYSKRIAQWCLNNNAYLAYASSAATYGAGEHGFSDNDSLTHKLKPLNPYGQSKLDFDCWVLKNNFEKEITGFRFFNVYGPNEYHKGDMRSLVHKGYEQIQKTGKLRLFKSYKPEYSHGGQQRDFVYVKDVVDTLIWFYTHSAIKGIYNLGQGTAQSWNDLAHALFRACSQSPVIEYFDMPQAIRNQYQYFTQADLSKLRKAGYPALFQNLESGVGDYVANYLSKSDPYL